MPSETPLPRSHTTVLRKTVTALLAASALTALPVPIAPAIATPTPEPPLSSEGNYTGKRVYPIVRGSTLLSTEYGVYGPYWKWKGYHTGVDFSAGSGTPIIAAANGTVTQAEWGGAYGNMVVQRIDPHTELLYAHMTHSIVTPGTNVKAGQTIGYVGDTGNTSGPHLHFEYRVDGEPVDPKPWLTGADVQTVAVMNPLQTYTQNTSSVLRAELQKVVDADNEVETARKAVEKATARVAVTTKAESRIVAQADAANTVQVDVARQAYMQGAASELSNDVDLVLQGPDAMADQARMEQTMEGAQENAGNTAQVASNMVAALHAETESALTEYRTAQSMLVDAEQRKSDAVAEYNLAARNYREAASATNMLPSAPMGIQTQVDGKGCPTVVDTQWVRDGITADQVNAICRKAVSKAPTVEAAKAIVYTFQNLGAPYACGGSGRLDPYRFDCSSLVARAYNEAAGLKKVPTWATTVTFTRPVPDYLTPVSTNDIRPGDLVFYAHPGTDGSGASGHVVMALGDGYMIDTGACGDGVRIQQLELNPDWTSFEGAMRVVPKNAR